MNGTVTLMDMGSNIHASGRVQMNPIAYCAVLLVRGWWSLPKRFSQIVAVVIASRAAMEKITICALTG